MKSTEKIENPKEQVVETQTEQEPIICVKKLAEFFNESGLKIESEQPDIKICTELREFIGDKQAEITSAKNEKGESFLLITIPCDKNLSAISIVRKEKALDFLTAKINERFEETKKRGKKLETENLIYISQNDGQCFDLRSVMPPENSWPFGPTVIMYEKSDSYYGDFDISIPPVGKFKPPKNPADRGLWNLKKKFEPLIHLHESGHCQQRNRLKAEKENPNLKKINKERNASFFALRTYRELKSQGLDLVPGLSNKQITNAVELALSTYDSRPIIYKEHFPIPQKHSEFYSNRTYGAWPKEDRNNCTIHILRLIYAVMEVVKNDPKIIADTLLYKGTPKIERISLRELLEKSEG